MRVFHLSLCVCSFSSFLLLLLPVFPKASTILDSTTTFCQQHCESNNVSSANRSCSSASRNLSSCSNRKQHHCVFSPLSHKPPFWQFCVVESSEVWWSIDNDSHIGTNKSYCTNTYCRFSASCEASRWMIAAFNNPSPFNQSYYFSMPRTYTNTNNLDA